MMTYEHFWKFSEIISSFSDPTYIHDNRPNFPSVEQLVKGPLSNRDLNNIIWFLKPFNNSLSQEMVTNVLNLQSERLREIYLNKLFLDLKHLKSRISQYNIHKDVKWILQPHVEGQMEHIARMLRDEAGVEIVPEEYAGINIIGGYEKNAKSVYIVNRELQSNEEKQPDISEPLTVNPSLFPNKDEFIEIMRLAIEDKISGCSYESFKSHFSVTKPPFERITWKGTEAEISWLFNGLKDRHYLINPDQYKLISLHFLNKKGNPFSNTQLSVAYSKAASSEPPFVTLLLKQLNKLALS